MIKNEDVSVSFHKRIPLIYEPMKAAVSIAYKKTSDIITEIPKDTKELMLSDTPKLYVGMHKSLWETMGIPIVIKNEDAKVPYVVIGKNLVKWPFNYFMKSVGCIYVERAAKDISQQDRYSAIEIKKKITLGLEKGEDILIFPMDGRTKTGIIDKLYSTPFDAVIETTKKPVYIIPVNVDYERVADMDRMLTCIEKNKSYTFRIWHFPDWWKNLGTMYVSFGEPIEITSMTNRKKINHYTLEKSLELVKILRPNIFAGAMLELDIKTAKEKDIINKIQMSLESYAGNEHKFRGFNNLCDIISNPGLTLNEPRKKYAIYNGYTHHLKKKY